MPSNHFQPPLPTLPTTFQLRKCVVGSILAANGRPKPKTCLPTTLPTAFQPFQPGVFHPPIPPIALRGLEEGLRPLGLAASIQTD
jgi:hypothetical protein